MTVANTDRKSKRVHVIVELFLKMRFTISASLPHTDASPQDAQESGIPVEAAF
jgi:hypothetical protein